MKGAARFLFGAAIGVAVGYVLMLLVRPANGRRPKRPDRTPKNKRDAAS